MRVACLGGGPAGLYFAISMKLRNPSHEVTIFERNRADDTFGWGVVLSDAALQQMQYNDRESADAIRSRLACWDDIAVIHQGTRTVSSGHGFAGIGRKQMLGLLQQRAGALGVDMRFAAEFTSAEPYRQDYDLVVACDGIHSAVRNEYAEIFQPNIDTRRCKFIWLGTHQKFDDAFTFAFQQTRHGWMWMHAYQFDADTATVIIECAQKTWDGWGFACLSKEETLATCQDIFAEQLGEHALLSNAAHLRGAATWLNFPRVNCQKWYHENIVLMGDAAATAHFSVGSGTRLAFDSAIALATYLHSEPTMEQAFLRYQQERRQEVLRLQSAARNSLEWFEQVERYLHLHPVQFNYSLLTRSQRISHENLRLRDGDWLGAAEKWFQQQADMPDHAPIRAPMFAPYRLRDMKLKNRIVVSPMAQYKAVDGCPTDWHLIHYGERAKGGAGLLYTEMACISSAGRITPGCAGLYHPTHEAAWRRLVDFVHAETEAKICCQIGHSGRKGSTRLGWEGMDRPLAENNWSILSASPLPWSAQNATPREITRAEMDEICQQFVASAEMAMRAGFDMIELHAAHGYLISSFISPLSNVRTDAYGGSLHNRMRYPLEILSALREAWPSAKPISVRISATDWVAGDGVTPEEAVEISRMFTANGADIIDVSAGQTSCDAQPVYGRMFQTPFSDHIRNEAGIPTMAVGNIYEPDHVNSILMAGRADLVCLARPHLADPYWTLRAAAQIGDRNEAWPAPYAAGRDQMWRLADRDREMAAGEMVGKV